MKKLFIAGLFFLLLTACSNPEENIMQCNIDDNEMTIYYDDKEVYKAIENGEELNNTELASINGNIQDFNEQQGTTGVESFMDNQFVVVFELSGGTCEKIK